MIVMTVGQQNFFSIIGTQSHGMVKVLLWTA